MLKGPQERWRAGRELGGRVDCRIWLVSSVVSDCEAGEGSVAVEGEARVAARC